MPWLRGRFTLSGPAVIQGLFGPFIGMKRCGAWLLSFLADSFQHNVLASGGEDAKIVTWRIQDLDFSDLSTPGHSDDPIESEASYLKREWDVTMNHSQAGPVSSRFCDENDYIDHCFQGSKRVRH